MAIAAAVSVDGRASARAISTPGSGSLVVERVGTRSLVTRAFATSPLRLLTPRNHGRAAWIYTSTYGGGLVDGDALRLDLEIGADAAALLATQAATKVYRSPRGTSMSMTARVGERALLVAAPDPVVCFRGASYRQDQRIDLAETGGLVFIDWLTSGRHAAGERWSFDRYASRLAISRQGRRVLLDALALDAAGLANRMGRFDVALVAIVLGPALVPHAESVLARVAATSIARRARLLVGASAIAGGGCLLRMIGTSVEDVGRAARGHLSFVPALLGDDPWSRKW